MKEEIKDKEREREGSRKTNETAIAIVCVIKLRVGKKPWGVGMCSRGMD